MIDVDETTVDNQEIKIVGATEKISNEETGEEVGKKN